MANVRTRMLMELGMGTDLQGQDYTKAACRAVHNALRQNSINVADAFGVTRDKMDVDVIIGVAKPDLVDKEAVAALLPYGKRQVICELGGLDTVKEDGAVTVLANAALIVHLHLPEGKKWGVAS